MGIIKEGETKQIGDKEGERRREVINATVVG